MKILVVDDSKNLLQLAREILDEAGYRDVLLSETGKQAWDIINREKIDLVLLDWHMPGMTGMDLLRLIKNNENTKRIHVIMLSAENHPQSVVSCMESGASDYMLKPPNPDILMEKIRRLFPAEKQGC